MNGAYAGLPKLRWVQSTYAGVDAIFNSPWSALRPSAPPAALPAARPNGLLQRAAVSPMTISRRPCYWFGPPAA